MAFRAYTAYHLDSGDGRHHQEILSSQQADICAFTSVGSTLRAYRMPDFLASSETETAIIIGTTPRLQEWPPRCLSTPRHGFQPFPDKYSINARRTTCAEASSAPRRRGRDLP